MMKGFLIVAGAVLVALGSIVPGAAYAPGGPVLLRDGVAGADTVPLLMLFPDAYSAPPGQNRPQPDTTIEPSISVNPGNPLNAIAVYQVDRVAGGGDADNGFATTFDGGVTWTYGYLPGLTYAVVPTNKCPRPAAAGVGPQCTFDRASDAVIAWGADPANPGKYFAYANSLVFNDGSISGDANKLNSGMAMNVSKDGGLNWSDAVFLEQDSIAGQNDKNWIVADNGSGVGHHTGRLYLVWDRVAPLVYTYCDPDVVASVATGAGCDKAANWTSAHNGSFYPFNVNAGIGSYPVVMPNGSLGVLFQGDFAGVCPVPNPPTDQPDCGVNTELQFVLAPAAGAVAWPAPLTFTTAVGIASNQTACCAEQRAGTLPSLAVDPVTGQLYAAWEDARFRTDTGNDILFSTSSDGAGATWSAATLGARVNQGPVNDHQDHWNAMIDVGKDGKVHVAYMQRDETPGVDPGPWSATGLSRYLHAYYQESSDHGATWTAPLRVDTKGTDVGYGAYSRGGEFQGDYNQISTASNGWSYIVRTVAGPKTPGEPCNCNFADAPSGHQHQNTWVSVVGPPATPVVPEFPLNPALVVLGSVLLLLGLRLRLVGRRT